MSNSSNRSQGLSAKAHGLNRKQIVGGFNLGGRMSFKSQAGIGSRHAAAVIHDLDGGLTGIFHNDLDVTGTSNNSILYQFLHHRCRALYYLPRSDLVSY